MAEQHDFDVRAYARQASTRPGVYCMLDVQQKVLYVGKARNLQERLKSYAPTPSAPYKQRVMIQKVTAIRLTTTATEGEALILEQQLINRHKPRYNILLRDDKSYPMIRINTADSYPRLLFYRGSCEQPGRYFGPYPNSSAVRDVINLMHKLFRLRHCDDSMFRNRTRPCLEYQIGRCSAPCVDWISEQDYRRDVEHALLFLTGRSDRLLRQLSARMEAVSLAQDYEQAAQIRDQIARLRQIHDRQCLGNRRQNLDILACSRRDGQSCVQLFMIREGRHLGGHDFYPQLPGEADEEEIMTAFLSRYYVHHKPPPRLLLSHAPRDKVLLEAAFKERYGSTVRIQNRARGETQRWLQMARDNSLLALNQSLREHGLHAKRHAALAHFLQMPTLTRMACFDISHLQGEQTVASCVVFDADGPQRASYRRLQIKGVTAGDDAAALRQALQRYLQRLLTEQAPLPDLLLIDGGRVQRDQALHVLQQLSITAIKVVAISKGAARREGEERLFFADDDVGYPVDAESPATHLLQRLRNEAHRFALAGHRRFRSQQRRRSTLEQIEGLGPVRRRDLLRHFGGWQGVVAAGAEDLSRVAGIGPCLAQRIYRNLHDRLAEESS